MKRFYKVVTIAESPEGYGIALDGKPVETPASKPLIVKSRDVADLLMMEWSEQENNILPDRMPVNQIVMTTLDKVHSADNTIGHIVNYIDTDLVFYRSEVEPYKTKQVELWDKWIAVAQDKFGVILKTTDQIESLTQEPRFSKEFTAYLKTLSDMQLTVFESLIDDTSSPVLALALFLSKAKAEDLYEAVLLEDLIRAEIYDENTYGAAPDQEKKRIALRRNLKAAEKLIPLI